MTGLTTHVLSTDEEFAAIAPEWDGLWARAGDATPFQSSRWLLPWWRHFSPGRLQAVSVRSEGHLIGLAPLYLDESNGKQRLLPVGISLSDYCDFLLDPACRSLCFRTIVERMGCAWPGAAWSLEELPAAAVALSGECPVGWTSRVEPQSACPVLVLQDDLRTTIPSRKYRKVRMARNRASRRGGLEIVSIGPGEADAFLDALFVLHDRRWQSRGGTGVLASEQVQRFHRDAAPLLLEAGLAQLFLLRIAGRTAGAYYGFQHGKAAYAYLGGLDSEFEYESPGTMLIAHAIEWAIGAGVREFHFLRGREPYKYEWGATDRWNYRRCITPIEVAKFAQAV